MRALEDDGHMMDLPLRRELVRRGQGISGMWTLDLTARERMTGGAARDAGRRLHRKHAQDAQVIVRGARNLSYCWLVGHGCDVCAGRATVSRAECMGTAKLDRQAGGPSDSS